MDLSFRSFIKDIAFRILMAAAGVGLFVSLALAGDYFDIGLLQSSGGILLVLLIGGPVTFVVALLLYYTAGKRV
ncbi:hypothetical protein ACK3SF_03215 [Candidatus Nanosalina sp. VS9-1]|uniref:hypothetical protein n=1 Tax=Candidatus Nanosalina sp. VS9-1 TaxID=3388566 RepID=UPI0039E07DCF